MSVVTADRKNPDFYGQAWFSHTLKNHKIYLRLVKQTFILKAEVI